MKTKKNTAEIPSYIVEQVKPGGTVRLIAWNMEGIAFIHTQANGWERGQKFDLPSRPTSGVGRIVWTACGASYVVSFNGCSISDAASFNPTAILAEAEAKRLARVEGERLADLARVEEMELRRQRLLSEAQNLEAAHQEAAARVESDHAERVERASKLEGSQYENLVAASNAERDHQRKLGEEKIAAVAQLEAEYQLKNPKGTFTKRT